MNLIQLIDCWRADDEFSWNNFILLLKTNFEMVKNTRGVSEKFSGYNFLNIIVNVNFFNDLKFKYYWEYYPETPLR